MTSFKKNLHNDTNIKSLKNDLIEENCNVIKPKKDTRSNKNNLCFQSNMMEHVENSNKNGEDRLAGVNTRSTERYREDFCERENTCGNSDQNVLSMNSSCNDSQIDLDTISHKQLMKAQDIFASVIDQPKPKTPQNRQNYNLCQNLSKSFSSCDMSALENSIKKIYKIPSKHIELDDPIDNRNVKSNCCESFCIIF